MQAMGSIDVVEIATFEHASVQGGEACDKK